VSAGGAVVSACGGGCGGGSDGGGHSAFDSGVRGAGRSAGSAVVSAWCASSRSPRRASRRDRSGRETTAGETTAGETTAGEADDEPGEEAGEPRLRIASARVYPAGSGTAARRREGAAPLAAAAAAAGAGTAGAAGAADVARPSRGLALATALVLRGLAWVHRLDGTESAVVSVVGSPTPRDELGNPMGFVNGCPCGLTTALVPPFTLAPSGGLAKV
jgi:hypothetical protein